MSRQEEAGGTVPVANDSPRAERQYLQPLCIFPASTVSPEEHLDADNLESMKYTAPKSHYGSQTPMLFVVCRERGVKQAVNPPTRDW